MHLCKHMYAPLIMRAHIQNTKSNHAIIKSNKTQGKRYHIMTQKEINSNKISNKIY